MATRKTSKTEEIKSEFQANASKVWLAGLGALATAEQEGGKLFRTLLKKGEQYEKLGKSQLEKLKEQVDTLAGVAKSKVGAFAEEAKERAGDAWAKVESTVEEKTEAVEERWDEKMHGVLRRVGVPSRNEIASLTRRVEELTRLVGDKAKPKSGTKKAAAKKNVAKKAAAKKPAAGKSASTRTRTKAR